MARAVPAQTRKLLMTMPKHTKQATGAPKTSGISSTCCCLFCCATRAYAKRPEGRHGHRPDRGAVEEDGRRRLRIEHRNRVSRIM